MKRTSAFAVIDFSDIPTGVCAVDSILKKASIAFVRAGTVTRGRYLVMFGGSTAATAESLAEALATSGNGIIDHAFLPDAHPALFDAAIGARRKSTGSLLIIETETASSMVRAVEAALKGTPVELMEMRLADAGLSGKGLALMAGSLHDIEYAAILAANGTGADAAPPRGFSFRLIAAPHEIVEREIAAVTRFDLAPLLELDGEAG
ncbi:MAG TPA: BMC domain-containing protein [Thermoanaerobaculia bacterium]|jgi:microcompartment protein CcmL/EutN|nr:BMC domain-containing protein [Thermoanaerobaculia bacterium]